jgi:hypothetical protein
MISAAMPALSWGARAFRSGGGVATCESSIWGRLSEGGKGRAPLESS